MSDRTAELRRHEAMHAIAMIDLRERIAAAAAAAAAEAAPPAPDMPSRSEVHVLEALFRRRSATVGQIAADMGMRRDTAIAAIERLRFRRLVRADNNPSRYREQRFGLAGSEPVAVETLRGVTVAAAPWRTA